MAVWGVGARTHGFDGGENRLDGFEPLVFREGDDVAGGIIVG